MADRGEIAETLRALGLDDAAIERAFERGNPESAIFEPVLMPAIKQRTVSAREIEERGGLSVAETNLMIDAFGLPLPDPDQPAFTPEEADVFVELKRLQEVWPPELGVQLSRVYGRLLARIAQTGLQLFRLYAEPRLRAEADDELSSLRAVQEAFARLLPLADPLMAGVHRRWIEHELAQAAVSAAESGAGVRHLPGSVEVGFLFCDLKDFTAFADTEGDAAAVDAIDRFADVVSSERGNTRFVKALGDGFMLCYSDAPEAVSAGARIIRGMQAPNLPGVHASAHHGVAVVREGDYFGGAVNLTARLLNAAGRDELVATRQAVDRADSGLEWKPSGSVRVRGVADPVDVFLLVLQAQP